MAVSTSWVRMNANFFPSGHPDHPARSIAYGRVLEAKVKDLGETDEAMSWFEGVMEKETDPFIRGDLLYRKFALLWEEDREGAIALAGEIAGGTEKDYRLHLYLGYYLMGEEQHRELADRVISEIAGRGAIPFVVGGTGLYIKALLFGLMESPPADPEVRRRINEDAKNLGWPEMHKRLTAYDPGYAAKISKNDRQRIQRALEYFEVCKKPISAAQKEHGLTWLLPVMDRPLIQ